MLTINFIQTTIFDLLPWQPKRAICENNTQKSSPQRPKGDEAESLQKCSYYLPLQKLCFYYRCSSVFVAVGT